MINFEKLIYQTREPSVSIAAFTKINLKLLTNGLPSLPTAFDLTYVTKEGKFTTRVQRYLKSQGIDTKQPIVATLINQIGNIAGNDLEIANTLFCFTNKIDWKAGDFGDAKSCFWGGRAGAKNMIVNNGGFALTIYNTERLTSRLGFRVVDDVLMLENKVISYSHDIPRKFTYGAARAWIIPIESGYALCNAYGYSMMKIGSIFLQYLQSFNPDWMSQFHQIVNHQDVNGTMYFNNNGEGIVFTEGAKTIAYPYDVKFKSIECQRCGTNLDSVGVDGQYEYNGDTYCESCWLYGFYDCEICGERYLESEMHLVDRCHYCASCLENLIDSGTMSRCADCSGLILTNTDTNCVMLDETGDTFCSECAASFAVCDMCESTFRCGNVSVVEGMVLCDDCHENYTVCPECYSIIPVGLFGSEYLQLCEECTNEEIQE